MELRVSGQGSDQGGCRCPCLWPDILGSDPVGSVLWVGDVGDDPLNCDGVERIPINGGLQADGEETSTREGRRAGIPPAGRCDGGGETTGGGDLCLHIP